MSNTSGSCPLWNVRTSLWVAEIDHADAVGGTVGGRKLRLVDAGAARSGSRKAPPVTACRRVTVGCRAAVYRPRCARRPARQPDRQRLRCRQFHRRHTAGPRGWGGRRGRSRGGRCSVNGWRRWSARADRRGDTGEHQRRKLHIPHSSSLPLQRPIGRGLDGTRPARFRTKRRRVPVSTFRDRFRGLCRARRNP